MAQLYDLLSSDRPLEVELDHKPYRTIFEAFRGRGPFIDMVYSTILPEIKDLQGEKITIDSLHDIRQQQTKEPMTWETPFGGYLDFVTDRRDYGYWRDPLLRLWLAEKGFETEMDLTRLAEAANAKT
ncbi:hypothetical protein N7493_002079 [Penicillium malachiteum]|uniref:Uncharacterized protein n=1 Tax=Penicillium malachiteum TaxID=1324776 RepID=A0AAD6HW10_9EURO|nr:hypothetical protein N7493_002079 [Penicillium malachiteum]